MDGGQQDRPLLGRSVRIYLADGTPSGIKHAELVNWTGQAIVCPRTRVPELSNWTETQRPGVYFLVGEDEDDTQRSRVYIGEAENVKERLRSHVALKEFWRTVVMFTSKDENLTKAHVKYLESRILAMATEVGRVRLENSGGSSVPALPRADRDAMEEFLGPMRILLGALGFGLLEPIRSATSSSIPPETFNLRVPKKGVDAAGLPTDDGFVVLKGSTGTMIDGDSLDAPSIAARAGYLSDGSFVREGDVFRVTRDVLFSSPSYAATILSGYQANGRRSWKTSDNRTLADVEQEELGED